MKKNVLLINILFLVFGTQLSQAQKVEVVSTTSENPWVSLKKKEIVVAEASGQSDISIYADQRVQVIDGIGGSFNELGWTAVSSLPAEKRQEAFDALFSEEGCNFSMCRLPIGSSDYALSYYSHAEVPEDFVMRDFNIVRDQYILIPYIKEALKVRKDLKLWASPWSPPAWMKVNNHYSLRRGDVEGRPSGNRMPEGAEIMSNATAFKMQERYLKAYALYFSKFVQAYKEEGVPLWAIMPQNEIKWAPNWPACTWRPEDMSYFIGEYLGPQFENDGLDTEIWLGTINNSDPNYVRTILNKEKYAKYIKGVGFQWSGSKALPKIKEEYAGMKYMQTENMCGEQENDWTSLEASWKMIVHYFKNKTGSYMYWNMILDETGKSAWGWPQNSMIVVDREKQEVIYNDEFYLFKHLSHYVQPGAHYLKSSEGDNHVAFELTDGRILLMMYNPEESAKKVSVDVSGVAASFEAKAKSINSVIFNMNVN
ncbi:glycoside hydrolase family 30 protein [Flammeovirga aprica]|uniref:Glycosyl hydrolase family 30 n=1 Tax=Flammeovirga aprica JL-4 TaxID=694437 RepID=A0A7X9P4C3_9BACT|nr:glycosyl hydrolase family 30 [Flammeovirga aprica]NME68772.1 glycosyl hydrolase family 30 [Flammeovirga aprica JL-4]